MIKPYRLPAIELADKPSEEIQLFRVGTFSHSEYGQFDITAQMLSDMKKNFDNRVRGIDLAIDYSHNSGDKAAGWIKDLYLADNGGSLWAKVDWTPSAQKLLGEKEFRYISPEFAFNYVDNETSVEQGPTLLGAGLTNRPVIKKMEPVIELQEYKLSKDKGNTMDQKPVTPPEAPAPEPKAPEAPAPKAADAPAETDPTKMTPEQLLALVKQLQAQCDTMAAEKAKADGAAKMAEKKTAFSKMLSEGKVCAAQEQSFIDGNMDEFVSKAQPVKLAEAGSGLAPKVEDKNLSIDDRIDAEAKKLMKEDAKLQLGEAYKKVLTENAELKNEKYKN